MRIIATPDFDKQFERLFKIYRRADLDLDSLVEALAAGPRPQDNRLFDESGAQMYKARLKNTSARSGTRSGFRVIYGVKSQTIHLLLIYAKTRTPDIPDTEIRRIARKVYA